VEIKCKRYYRWKSDTVLQNKQCKTGDIYTHYQGMNASLTLFNREPITDWLLWTTLYDLRGNEIYEADRLLTNNRQEFVVKWHVDDNKRKAGWKMKCQKGLWHNINTNIVQIVGNEDLEESYERD